jgi:hypothetical protein
MLQDYSNIMALLAWSAKLGQIGHVITNWSNDARIGFLLTTWVVKDFFIVEDRMFGNYEDNTLISPI